MKRKLCLVIVSFLASICYFACYFIQAKETIYLILGFAWVCISIGSYADIVKSRKKEKEQEEQEEKKDEK